MNQSNISSKDFYELAISKDTYAVNKVSGDLIERMALYLKTVMRADEATARDCAQQAFEKVYEKILSDSLSDVDDIYGYLITSSKNEYLMTLRRKKHEVVNEQHFFTKIESSSEDDVVKSLYSEEKEKLLNYCVDKLKKGKRTFFLFVLKHINEKDKDAAKKLNISHSSFRTKKSRIIEALRDCVKNALSE